MLSLPKILLLAAIVLAVFYGTRLLRGTVGGKSKGESPKSDGDGRAVDLAKCRVCGSYVDPSAGGCERQECPYA